VLEQLTSTRGIGSTTLHFQVCLQCLAGCFNVIGYDRPTIEEFNVDSNAECDQFNLAQETEPNETNASAYLVQYSSRSVKGVRKE